MGGLWRFQARSWGAKPPFNLGSGKFWPHCPGVLAGGFTLSDSYSRTVVLALLISRRESRTLKILTRCGTFPNRPSNRPGSFLHLSSQFWTNLLGYQVLGDTPVQAPFRSG